MRRILAKRKAALDEPPFLVYRQDNDTYIVEDTNEVIPGDQLLFPNFPEHSRDRYETAIIQGLLSNPNIIVSRDDLYNEDIINDILSFTDRFSALSYYDNCRIYT